MTKRIIYWFRNDLRLLDNEAFLRATQEAEEVVPVYVFDPRSFVKNSLGFRKTAPFRARFLWEAVQNLRKNLRLKGGDLLIRVGEPEKIIAELAEQYDAQEVFTSKEVALEETTVESSLSKRLKVLNVDFELVWTATLYHPRDLPFWISRLPDVFTEFRKQVEKHCQVRSTFPESTAVKLPAGYDAGELPTLDALGFTEAELHDRTGLSTPFAGGEDTARQRIQRYFWEEDRLRTYKDTRNGLLGPDYSSRFSAWLSLGCLSPRYIYEEVKRYETERVANDSTYWLIFELLWRDYFHFVSLRHGTRIFKASGIKHDVNLTWSHNRDQFEKWRTGQTGIPFIDANMRELMATGYLSNRGRQNVASFLAKDLNIDWTWGASYFESQLTDYDVCSNWCNWNYVAGVGNDPRQNRYFNILSQANHYDPEGTYVKYWLPELAQVPAGQVHSVWQLSVEEQQQYGVMLGSDYPLPIIRADKWLKPSEDR
ncbi:DASH family cryptochrome [Telluribacter sp.]|jgi:deoxyribodipyrimidine photo-lyase|uniref:DASH family cryptochrome n=1 Tax=Telluribacter sp. TaxID=1978767 RepID=UPI002E150F21|nr:DASH family cryptochrome [Telluribacter sp.]